VEGADEARVTVDRQQELRIGLDHVYRILAEDNAPFPQGTIGWREDPDTFIIKSIILGQMGKNSSRIQFAGDSVHMTLEEEFTGSKVELQGILDPAAERKSCANGVRHSTSLKVCAPRSRSPGHW
jgi:hypothetical protein